MTPGIELVLEEFKNTGAKITPLFPAILVRVLPKREKLGSIWLPDTSEKSKVEPLREGIVLATYKPKFVEKESGKRIKVDSGLVPGQVVMFPYWSGERAPYLDTEGKVVYLDDAEYRLVPAKGILGTAGKMDTGEVAMIVDYDVPSLADTFATIFMQMNGDTSIDAVDKDEVDAFIVKVREHFDIVPKLKESIGY